MRKQIEKYNIHTYRKIENSKKDKKPASFKEISNFGKYYTKFKKPLALVCIILLFSATLSIISPIYTGKLIAMFSETMTDSWPIIKMGLIVLGLAILNHTLSLLGSRIWNFISVNSTFLITKDLTYRINRISQKSFDSAGSGTFTTRMYGDVEMVGNAPLRLADYVIDLVSQIGFLTYTFSLNPFVGLFMIFFIVANIFTDFKSINTAQTNKRFIKKVHEEENSFRSENLRGIKDIRGLNATMNVAERSLENTARRLEYELGSQKTISTLRFIGKIIKALLDFAFIVLALELFLTGQIAFASFLIIFNYRNRISGFANYFVNIKEYFSECALSAQRLNEIFDENLYPSETFGSTELSNINGYLEFKNVSFGYSDDYKVLKDINFVVKPNSITSFVGESGAGKSTIVSLIDKLYSLKEDEGQILIDGVNLNDLNEKSLRSNICTITQNPYIFNMSVKDNLLLANPNATEQEIISALERANIWSSIEKLPNKLDSKLGENGVKISGGQKQRLAIARAILRNSKIILFDEATSALDNINQSLIKDTIKDLSKDHTVIMVAHRLSTVIDSDNIIFIKDGKIFAEGTHNYLINSCKEYQKLYVEETKKSTTVIE